MIKYVYLSVFFLFLNSCVKYESIPLELKVLEVLKGNFFPFETYFRWKYDENSSYSFDLSFNGPNRIYQEGSEFINMGLRQRTTPLFGYVSVWEIYFIKRTNNAVVLQIDEQFNFSTVLRSIPYDINLYTKEIFLGAKWQDQRTIEYTRFQQSSGNYLSNAVFPTTIYYEVIGFNDTKVILGKEYQHVMTYRLDYIIDQTPLYREFMLAKDVGIISINDNGVLSELSSVY